MTLFSVSGSLANIPYVDILGKSFLKKQRKSFFSLRQIISSIGILTSAFAVRELLKRYDFPINYSVSFLMASILLLTASLGFFNIKEIKSKPPAPKPIKNFSKRIISALKTEPNLTNYLIVLNTTGLALSFSPFMIMLAKEKVGISSQMVGNILLLKVAGMIIPSIWLYFIHKKYNYKNVLFTSIAAGGLLPVLSLILIGYPFLYQFLFIISGIFLTLYKIAINGILIEISTDENRTFFTGITGAGNISASLLPIFFGTLIVLLGYKTVFVLLSIIILSGFIFAKKMKCEN
jgi:hypothetical protein